MKYQICVFTDMIDVPNEDIYEGTFTDEMVHHSIKIDSAIELADTDLIEFMAHSYLWRNGFDNKSNWAVYYLTAHGDFAYIIGSH